MRTVEQYCVVDVRKGLGRIEKRGCLVRSVATDSDDNQFGEGDGQEQPELRARATHQFQSSLSE